MQQIRLIRPNVVIFYFWLRLIVARGNQGANMSPSRAGRWLPREASCRNSRGAEAWQRNAEIPDDAANNPGLHHCSKCSKNGLDGCVCGSAHIHHFSFREYIPIQERQIINTKNWGGTIIGVLKKVIWKGMGNLLAGW